MSIGDSMMNFNDKWLMHSRENGCVTLFHQFKQFVLLFIQIDGLHLKLYHGE